MRIGRYEITRLAEKKPDLDERGSTGTGFFSGTITGEEYNSDLVGSKGRKIYDKMRRSDGQVKASLMVCNLPLLAATWGITPASSNKRDEEIALELEDNLYGMTITWESFLRHALMILPFGFSMFEKVWELQDGKYRFRKFAPRLPNTLYKWQFDESGGLAGIEQLVWKNESYQFIKIPVEKLLVFTNEKEGSNFEGISILRAAYKHWFYKDNLYRIDAIAAERHGIGLPVFWYPADATADDKAKIDDMGKQLYANERMYLRLPVGYEFDIKGTVGTIRSVIPSIEHHNKQISLSILTQFLNLGQGGVGSYALSQDQSSLFLMSLRAVANNICDTMNRYAIPQWMALNYGDKELPKLTATGLETREIKEYAAAVSGLVGAGALSPTRETEQTLRDILHLPPLPEKEGEVAHKEVFHGMEFRRELKGAEKFVDFTEISKRLDGAVDDFVKETKKAQKKQIDKLVEVALKIVEKRQLDKVDSIDVPYKTEVAQAMEGVLDELYQYGREQVKQELKKQKHTGLAEPLGPEDVALIKKFLESRAKSSASVMATKLKSAVTWEALRQIKEGIADKAALTTVMNDLSDRELKATARMSVSEAFNFGRSAEAKSRSKEVSRVIYSAINDDNTCTSCAALDGNEWNFDDDKTDYYFSGNPDCEGGSQCRCLLVFVGGES